MPQKAKVAVIGAGALGLMALKQFKEDGFEVTGFEERPYIGGLWKDTEDNKISVHATTIFNTSKFRAAISDFPFPEEVDTYPTAAQIYSYLRNYADHFSLHDYIQVSHKVSHIFRVDDYWTLEIEDVKTGRISTQNFDRVCVATGSFYTPRWPKLDGLGKFQGKVLHSIDFHSSEQFKDQNVLIIGMHATAQDVTNALSTSAKRVYLSHRGGVSFLPRYTSEGETLDTQMKLPFLMFQLWLEGNLPSLWSWIMDKLVQSISKKAFPDIPDEWGLRPGPSTAVSTPLMADTLYPFLVSGFAEPVPAVKQITGSKTVELTNGRILDDIDTILYCTGYHFNIPDNLVPVPKSSASTSSSEIIQLDTSSFNPYPQGPGSNPQLFMNIFPLSADSAIRNTLAFLGQGGTPFPGFIQFEMQAMAVSQIWRGSRVLPSHAAMTKWYKVHSQERLAKMKRYNVPAGSTFYPAFVPFPSLFPWLDSVAGTGILDNMGGKLNGLFNYRAWHLWWTDRELYNLCTRGILSPTMFRVFETGGRKALGRDEVKNMLKRDNELCERAAQAKRVELQLGKDAKKNI